MDLLEPKLEQFADHDSMIDSNNYDSKDWSINLKSITFNESDPQCTSDNERSARAKNQPPKKYKKKRQQCPKCSMNYSKREYLSKHMKNEHNVILEKKKPGRQSAFLVSADDPRPYKCDQCVKEYTKSKHLARHRRTHLEKKRCNECREICGNYADHMLKMHGIDLPRPFECDICKKTYRTKSNIQSHMRIHRASSRVFTCTVCPKTFCFGTDLRKHIRTHSQNRSIICDICGDAFKSADTLKCHLRRHTGERPYKCSLCPRAFSTSNSLDIHFRTHTGERPFQCEFCQKRFSDSSTLLVHKRLHTNENPYMCHLCGRRTKQASNLRSHYKHFHKNNDITGRQIRLNSRIFNRFTQTEIDAELQKVGDLMAMLERGLQEFHREEKEKCNEIEKVLKETISTSLQIKMPASDSAKPDLKIENDVEMLQVNVRIKTDDDLVKTETVEPITSTVRQIGNTSISLVKRTTRSKHKEHIDTLNNQQPKIESVFLDDEEYHQPEIANISIDEIKYEDNSDNVGWQNGEDSSHEPFDDIKIETITTEIDVKTNDGQCSFGNPTIKMDHIKAEITNGPCFSDNENENLYNDVKSFKLLPKSSKLKMPTNSKTEMEKCIPCNRKFHDISKHWIEMHSGIERPYECFICHKNYKRFEHIKYHMKIHGDERNYICHVCGDAFFLGNELRKHIMNRHQVERPYKCTFQQCKKCFKNQHALNVHMRTHSGIKPHVCIICTESFSALSSLKIHERKHTGEKPYVCKYCDKAFADCSTHKQHVRIHTGDKPYKCHLCDRRTAQAGNLKSHYRHYHKIIVKSVSMYMEHPFSDAIPPNHHPIANFVQQTRRIEE